MKKQNLQTLATVERERERERERESLFIQPGIKLYSNKFNEKITIKNNVNKLKIDSNKKPVLDTG